MGKIHVLTEDSLPPINLAEQESQKKGADKLGLG